MSRGRRSKKKSNILDLQVVILIVASILLAVLIYTESGKIGETISPILGGIMGWIKYIIPIGTFAMAIFMAKEEDKDSFSRKIMLYAVFLLCISTVITVFQITKGSLNMSSGLKVVIKEAFQNGTNNSGGGAVGAVFAYGLVSLIRSSRFSYISYWDSHNRFYFLIWNKTC